MSLRRLLLGSLLTLGLLIEGCSSSTCPQEKLTIGIIDDEVEVSSLEKYQQFKEYLGKQTCTFVELEPTFNELTAIEKVNQRTWLMVFAPPGVAAIAIEKKQYIPIFSWQELDNKRSVIVVKKDSSIQNLSDLNHKIVALGEPGSAPGYYLPLYDLYGLTLAEIRFAPTPKTVLEWLSQNTIEAGALSEDEFQRYRREFKQTKFRVLHKTRFTPPGVVLLAPTVERKKEQQIINAMKAATPNIIGTVEYLPNEPVPNYEPFIELVEKVRSLETKLQRKPVVLR